MEACSNSLDFPIAWLYEDGNYLHSTSEECCLEHFNERKDCVVEEVCTYRLAEGEEIDSIEHDDSTCRSSIPWHPSSLVDKCSNGLDFPHKWIYDEGYDHFLQGSAADCCSEYFFSRGIDCIVEDVCIQTVSYTG